MQQKDEHSFWETFQKAGLNILQAIPIILSVLLLFGLYRTFVPQKILTRIFTGNPFLDPLIGAISGSLFAGNAVNSYIIGGELLKDGVSLFAVTAFLVTWVTIGFIQFPAEVSFLGKNFAIKRNVISFGLSFVIALVTVFTLSLFR
ncbi:permease [Calditrichota bacterium LG25]